MARNDLIQFRVSTEDKERIRSRAQSVGLTLTEFARERVLESIGGKKVAVPKRKGQARGSDSSASNEGAKQEPVPRTPEERFKADVREAADSDQPAEVTVQAGTAETQEVFVKRRTTQLYGQGNTMRVAKRLAKAEWRNR